MPQQPWRDVCSSELWTNTTEKYKSARGRTSLHVFINNIARDLREYHLLFKTMMGLFQLRINRLKTIEGTINSYLSQGEGQRAPNNFKKLAGLLQHQAKLKAGYLQKIKAFYQEGGAGHQFLDPVQFINFLRAPHAPPPDRARLQPGTRMEALDPAHRSFEMHFGADGRIGAGEFDGLMQSAFGEWIGALKKSPNQESQLINRYPLNEINPDTNIALQTPFFVWMENHYMCVGTDSEIYQGFQGDLPVTGLRQINYSPYGTRTPNEIINAADEIHWLVLSSKGLVMEFPLGANDSRKLRIFDTQHLPGKGGESKSAAYAWAACGTLLAGEHKTHHLHHSSFVGGAEIRCSGMINVNRGKVEMISNNSGHYRPSVENLREFAKWLNDRQVFNSDSCAIYRDEVGLKNVPIGEFLGGQVNLIRKRRPVNPQITIDLNNLGNLMGAVVQKYSVSRTKGGIFHHTSKFRSKSVESQKALEYLQNGFPEDIKTAKVDLGDPSWYSFPEKVIKTLLGEPNSLPFTELLKQVSDRPVIGKKFSPLVAGLTPLKKSSTMHAILSEEFKKWDGFG